MSSSDIDIDIEVEAPRRRLRSNSTPDISKPNQEKIERLLGALNERQKQREQENNLVKTPIHKTLRRKDNKEKAGTSRACHADKLRDLRSTLLAETGQRNYGRQQSTSREKRKGLNLFKEIQQAETNQELEESNQKVLTVNSKGTNTASTEVHLIQELESVNLEGTQVENNVEMAFTIQEITNLIPEFDGNSKELPLFIENMDMLWTQVPDNDQARNRFTLTLRLKLRGKAAEALKNATAQTDWPTIRNTLSTNLRSKTSTQVAQLELSRVKQYSRENTEDFGNRVLKLLETLNSSYDPSVEQVITNFYKTTNDELAKRAFEDGLYDNKLKERVIAGNKQNLKETIEYAREQELRLKPPNTLQKNRCNFCGLEGHIEKECRKKARQYQPSTSQVSTFKQNDNRCYICNKKGHFAKVCNNRNETNGEQSNYNNTNHFNRNANNHNQNRKSNNNFNNQRSYNNSRNYNDRPENNSNNNNGRNNNSRPNYNRYNEFTERNNHDYDNHMRTIANTSENLNTSTENGGAQFGHMHTQLINREQSQGN